MGYIYISYNRQNQNAAHRLQTELHERGYTVWIDTADLRPGTDWKAQIDTAITDADIVVVLLSPAALESRPIQNEIETARSLNKPIIPVIIERTRLPDALANRQYVDFTGGDERAIERIVQAIEVSAPLAQRRQTMPMPAADPAPRAANRSRRRLIFILLTAIFILIAVFVALFALGQEEGNTLSSAPANLEDMTEVVTSAPTVTATATATVTPTSTPQPTATRVPTDEDEDGEQVADEDNTSDEPTRQPNATTNPTRFTEQTATAIAQAISAQSTRESVNSLSDTQLTMTSMANAIAVTVTRVRLQATPTATDIPMQTQIAQAVEATMDAFRATEESMLSPAEMAQFTQLINADPPESVHPAWVWLSGGISLLALGSTIAIFALLRSDSLSTARRRSAHGGHGHSREHEISKQPENLLEDYQIFISCSDRDREFIQLLVDDLQNLGYLVWWYVKDAPGLPFGNEIRSAIFHTKVFLIVITPDSMQSKHVEEELRWAEVYDRPIVSALYRSVTLEERFYGLAKGADIDFTNDGSYRASLELLTQAIDHHLRRRLELIMTDNKPE